MTAITRMGFWQAGQADKACRVRLLFAKEAGHLHREHVRHTSQDPASDEEGGDRRADGPQCLALS